MRRLHPWRRQSRSLHRRAGLNSFLLRQLVATVLVVLAIIWHQEHSLDSLRTDLLTEINHLEASVTDAINGVEITPRTDISDDPPQ